MKMFIWLCIAEVKTSEGTNVVTTTGYSVERDYDTAIAAIYLSQSKANPGASLQVSANEVPKEAVESILARMAAAS